MTPTPVPHHVIRLSDAAWAVVCGMVQTTDAVDTEAIVTVDAVWDEVREAFPLAAFHQAVEAGLIEYEVTE